MFANLFTALVFACCGLFGNAPAINSFTAHPPLHVQRFATNGPTGLTPSQIKTAYHLPATGGAGKTIAVVVAYDDPNIAADLNAFSTQYGLPQCNQTNPCFSKHAMTGFLSTNSGWSLEAALDVEWAHAIAPQAKILLVEARSASGNNLLAAVDYARKQPGVVAVSMSWGGSEFAGQTAYDSYFTSAAGAAFFAASGDGGNGVFWPAVSSNVTAVGGTTLSLNPDGSVASEVAWPGSGGGVSAYTPKPAYQSALSATGRSIPDVAYDADPATGFSVYSSVRYSGVKGWFQVGGTSAGTPQWAAIYALGGTATNTQLYADAAGPGYANVLQDIITGSNGACGAVCTAGPGYDAVTGLGTPLTTAF